MNATIHQPWRLGGVLGVGSLATVYRAVAPGGAVVAAKILHPSRSLSGTAEAALVAEAQLLQGIRHPNIVEVLGTAVIDGETALLMELVEGQTLETVLAGEAPLSEPRIRALGSQIAAGLAAAHAHGVFHRDLKPANVLVTSEGVAKVADFGLARLVGSTPSDFQGSCSWIGSPSTMAPEAADPLASDGRSDLYALGCILFEMATGRPPFEGPTALAVLEQHRDAPIPPISGYSDGFIALVQALLAKSPFERIQTASAVVQALRPETQGALALFDGGLTKRRDDVPCSRCGGALFVGVAACLRCGTHRPFLAAGRHCVVVEGPADDRRALLSDARARLLRWARARPELCLETNRLEAERPQVPFVLLRGLSSASAESIRWSLLNEEVAAAVTCGTGLRNASLRKVALREQPGILFLLLLSGISFITKSISASLLPIIAACYMLSYAVLTAISVVPKLRPKLTSSGCPLVRIGEVERTLAALPEVSRRLRRDGHKDALAGVASQVAALQREIGVAEGVGSELVRAVEVAVSTVERLDGLDHELTVLATQPDSAGSRLRELMTQRDRGSARLLELCATLESLRARATVARRSAMTGSGNTEGGSEPDSTLEELRLRVEALEELERDPR